MEISPNRLPMGSVHQVKVLGCLAMIDEGETDWKIIAIDVNDPRASSLETVEDLAATEEGISTPHLFILTVCSRHT